MNEKIFVMFVELEETEETKMNPRGISPTPLRHLFPIWCSSFTVWYWNTCSQTGLK